MSRTLEIRLVACCLVAGMGVGTGCGGQEPLGDLSAAVHAAGAVHSVTGSGFVPPGPTHTTGFRQTVAAHADEDGNAWGAIVAAIDLTYLGRGILRVSGKVDCLHVEENQAWVTAVVTHSSDTDIAPPGVARLILKVQDLGGNGEDVMNIDNYTVEDDAIDCHEPPEMSDATATPGNYTVR